MTEISTLEQAAQSRVSRRRFVGMAGALAGAGLLAGATGCKPDEEEPGLSLGASDIGYMNCFYLVKQLEADFYIRVGANIIANEFAGLSAAERNYFNSIRAHEIAHRELLRSVLGASALATLEFDYSSIDFKKRTSLIDTAITLEDLGVSIFNGVGHKFSTSSTGKDYAMVAAKMASVEARHSALVRTLKQSGTFADDFTTDYNGLDIARTPAEMLSVAQRFIKTKINSTTLPQ